MLLAGGPDCNQTHIAVAQLHGDGDKVRREPPHPAWNHVRAGATSYSPQLSKLRLGRQCKGPDYEDGAR